MTHNRNDNTASMSNQLVSYLTYPFTSCLPSTSSAGRSGTSSEQQGLLSENTYDDSDAISLLSNIANRSRRRSRSSRRREEWSKRAAVLGCGLFGRPKGQIQRRELTIGDGLRSQHRRDDSRESSSSRGAESDEEGGIARSLTGSFGAGQDSGDEDAGMLEDDDIAEISQSRDDETEGGGRALPVPTVEISEPTTQHEEELERQQKEAEERAAIKAKLDREAEEFAKAEAEDAARRKAEEEALAAEEEAAIAKAKRRAERRAIKEGLIKVRNESQRDRRRTEAEAEAAAGGFDFAEEVEQQEVSPQGYHDYRGEEGRYEEEPSHYPSEYGPEGYSQYPEYPQQTEYPSPQFQQQEVVHHHHYYTEPQQNEAEYDDRLLSPNFRLAELPSFEPQKTQETAVEEDEDDADIAGITFSKGRKGRSRGEGGSNTYSAGRSNGSGSGSRQSGSASGQRQVRYEAHRKGSDQSAENNGGGGGSSSGKRSYRDRPRRHERTGSKSTGSGTGARLREGVPSRTMATSPTIDERIVDQRADAAAGGFDDFSPPPEYTHVQDSNNGGFRGSDYRARERRYNGDNGSSNSSGPRREKRREGPASAGGLNFPRNPGGNNVFI